MEKPQVPFGEYRFENDYLYETPSEYHISNPEHNKEYRQELWDMATGLQAVDDLTPSDYLYQLASQHVDGRLTNDQIEALLYKKYENETPEDKENRKRESDLVSNRMVKLLMDKTFSFSPVTLKYIHKSLFEGIYEHTGMFRKYNISKKESILHGKSVKYANYRMIEDTLTYDFEEEKKRKYSELTKEKAIARISEFTSSIWQVHPFMEGNTRTTAAFIECYLNSKGFVIDNFLFKEKAKYFRNALVRANYADYQNGIDVNTIFLERFFDNLLFGGKNELHNRDMIIEAYFKKIH